MLTNFTNKVSGVFRALEQLRTTSEKCQSKKGPRRTVPCKQLELLQASLHISISLPFKFKSGALNLLPPPKTYLPPTHVCLKAHELDIFQAK